MPERLNRLAALLRFGLLHGLLEPGEVVAWADAEIGRAEHPHPALFEVSTAGSRSAADVADELRPLAAGCAEGEIVEGIFALMHRALSRDARTAYRIAHAIDLLAIEDVRPPDGDPGGWMMYFADAMDLARDGIQGTEAEVTAEMLNFLRPYAGAAEPFG